MILNRLSSRFLHYLINLAIEPGEKLPPINEISQELQISAGKVREELEVARYLGLVTVKPKVGIVRQPFSFAPAVLQSVLFGLGGGEASFAQFSKLRQVVEAGFWEEAVTQLTPEDISYLKQLIDDAWKKLRGNPVHVPNTEHRLLHLTVFKHLENPFVQGVLQAYWDAYEASELTRFMGYQYWLDVWKYHEQIIQAIEDNDLALGKTLLIKHFDLLPAQTMSVG